MLIFCLLVSILVWHLKVSAQVAPATINYFVDVRQPGRRGFQIQAEIGRLTNTRPVMRFLGLKNGSTGPTRRLSAVGMISKDKSFVPLQWDDDRYTVEDHTDDSMILSYRLASSSFHDLDSASYLDEKRGIFHPQEVLVDIEGHNTKSTLTFLLPPRWQVITTAKADAEGVFRIDAENFVPFYLGQAGNLRESIGGTEVRLAIEDTWPVPVSSLIRSVRTQLKYRQSTLRNPRSGSLLGVFLSDAATLAPNDLVSFGTSKLLALAASRTATEPAVQKQFEFELSRALTQCYFPVLESFAPVMNPSSWREYLAMKARLKTGGMTQGEFLDEMATRLWARLNGSVTPRSRSVSGSVKEEPRLDEPKDEIRDNCFLLDLSLAFYGDSIDSLEEFLQSRLIEPRRLNITPRDLWRQFSVEARAGAVLDRLASDAARGTTEDLLKPFGLVFDKRELPHLPFVLTETFQVSELQRPLVVSDLRVGDRILAINDHRLALPDDLLKCRSRLRSGGEVQLAVERNGAFLNLRQPVGNEIWVSFQINKLADADKQEKLARFLARFSEGA